MSLTLTFWLMRSLKKSSFILGPCSSLSHASLALPQLHQWLKSEELCCLWCQTCQVSPAFVSQIWHAGGLKAGAENTKTMRCFNQNPGVSWYNSELSHSTDDLTLLGAQICYRSHKNSPPPRLSYNTGTRLKGLWSISKTTVEIPTLCKVLCFQTNDCSRSHRKQLFMHADRGLASVEALQTKESHQNTHVVMLLLALQKSKHQIRDAP